MLLRAALEQATHRFVIRRRLPPPFRAARIYASPEGGLRYLRPRMDRVDPVLLRLVTETVRPGDTVWDIGANVGLFSFAAAIAAGPDGHVLSVEADTVLVGLLRPSAAAGTRHTLVEVFPAAVAEECGVARFCIARSHLDGFGTTQTGGIRTTELVPTISLDWLASHFPRPDVIKIDVEGAEAHVLAGGPAVLRAHPRIICEVAKENAAAVSNLLARSGYTLYDGEQPASQRLPTSEAPPNTLAIRGPWTGQVAGCARYVPTSGARKFPPFD
jgi:FkbM family methyltransferase